VRFFVQEEKPANLITYTCMASSRYHVLGVGHVVK
jgi:hypothetical protein